jgi:hypothetical protein
MDGPCERQQELVAKAQRHLLRLAELARCEAQIIAGEGRETGQWLAIDQEIEAELGRKERSLGALRQHQKEHGC